MSIEEQADADFSRARRRAFLRRVGTRLRDGRASGRLPCFEESRRRLGAGGVTRLGRRVVRTADVVGSVGRCSEFDQAFLPVKRSTRERWKRIDKAFHRAEELPPVSLYKLGDAHFVEDGNHRVSVARFHGVEWIDAEVTRFRVPSPADPAQDGCPERRGPGRAAQDRDGVGSPPNLPQKVEGKGAAATYNYAGVRDAARNDGRREMMDFQVWKQHREEMMQEVRRNRLAKTLRPPRKRRGADRASSLTWELERIAGRLRKFLRTLKNAG